MKKSEVIGICGVSCSGKTTALEEIKKVLNDKATYISFDDYYISSSKMKNKNISWESPEHFRYGDFKKDLAKTISANKSDIIIAEGFVIFYDEGLRNLFDKKIFIDLPEKEIIKRRIERRRGTESDIEEYVYNQLIPGQREFVYPQKQFAEFIIDGLQPTQVISNQILEIIETN